MKRNIKQRERERGRELTYTIGFVNRLIRIIYTKTMTIRLNQQSYDVHCWVLIDWFIDESYFKHCSS